MTNTIRYMIEAAIASEQLDDYKKVATKLVENIKASEPDTSGFGIYFNDDESIRYLFEEYKSSEAVFAHMENSGGLIALMIEMTTTTRFEVYGNPSDALRQALEPFGATFIRLWQGI
jgi:quinol monooxygenase YgiN